MSARYDCTDAEQREAGLAASVNAVQEGGLVVFPTDTVYGVGADAFKSTAVSRCAPSRERGRNVPPPVLVGSVAAAAALTESLGPFGQDLIDEFWPGPLTLVFRASATLQWDLGDTMGTVAVRMPLHPVALDLLRRTGPMAVSGANRQGLPAATTAAEAENQLGDAISVYLDGGACADSVPSTILDLTGTVPRMLRAGALSIDELRKVVPVIDLPAPAPEPELSPADRRAAEAIAAAKAALTDTAAKAASADTAARADDANRSAVSPPADDPSQDPGIRRLTARRHARVSLHPDHRGGGDLPPHPAGAAGRDRHARAARRAQQGCAQGADPAARRPGDVRRPCRRPARRRPAQLSRAGLPLRAHGDRAAAGRRTARPGGHRR